MEKGKILCYLNGLLPSHKDLISDEEGQICGKKLVFTPIPIEYVAPVEKEEEVVFGAGIGGGEKLETKAEKDAREKKEKEKAEAEEEAKLAAEEAAL